jgi:hypothetical protein
LLCGFAVLAQETPPPKAVITIKPTDDPLQMEALKPLLTKDIGRLWGESAWKPPVGDPSTITKADYLELLKPDLAEMLNNYGKEPTTAKGYAYEAIPVFAAFYKATGDPKYLKLLVNTYKEYCAYLEQEVKDGQAEMAKDPNGRPGIGRYWTGPYIYLVIPLESIKGTPEYDQIAPLLGRALTARAEAWPVYWEGGPQNRSMAAAFWYDIALKYTPDPLTPKMTQLKAYADSVWNSWWNYRDVEEDDPSYTSIDVTVADAGALMRGVQPWEDAEARNLWLFYARQMANDGDYPAYGDAGTLGNYFLGLELAEIGASRCKDGQAKWFAHRAFFNGRDRIKQMIAGIGSMQYVYVAMAYLYADDTVKEIPPKAGLTVAQRRYHWMNDFNHLAPGSGFFSLENRWAPSKLIFRAGPKETDQYLLVQAAGMSGHGHPDAGAVLQYSGDYAFYLCHGLTRLDHDMEQHNLFVLRDPVKDKPWPATMTGEDYAVPVSGQTSEGAYARMHIQESIGAKVEDAWKQAQAWAARGGGWPPNIGCGYKNWPVRLDRSVLFVNNRFAVVRDVMTPTLAINAQIGQNWIFGNLGPTIGRNWVNVWTRNPLSGYYYGVKTNPEGKFSGEPGGAPIYTAPRDLLIWFVPQKDAVMQVVDGPVGSWYGNYFINLSRRVWCPRTGDWQSGQPQAFTTVLLPHLPSAEPEKLAATIATVSDAPGVTVLKVTEGDTVRLIVMNSSGEPITAGTLVTDAEAALLTSIKGKPTHLSLWHAHKAALGKKKLLASAQAKDLDITVK